MRDFYHDDKKERKEQAEQITIKNDKDEALTDEQVEEMIKGVCDVDDIESEEL